MALSITPVAPESSVSTRELVVLGTASQVPTRYRNHNGYLLLWDGQGLLFDPGEGTQRQMTFAGVSATDITRILITHFHGDHSLGLAGICQRISLDRVPHTVPVHFPASGERFYWRLKRASIYHDVSDMEPCPIEEGGVIASGKNWSLSCLPLDHGVEAFGYRLAERDSVRMLPEKLSERGIRGRDIGVLQRSGSITLDGVRTELADVSEHKAGQKVAFVMDTRLCDACFELADGADMLICESTYLNREKKEARAHGHMTAREAGLVAQEAGVRTLVLTHFSQRYPMNAPFKREAAEVFDGEIVVAEDGLRVPVPKRC